MLARGALCRLAAEVPKQAAHDLPKLATLVQTARSGFSLPIRTLAHVTQLQTRSYATAKAEKDPAAPVKKAVKAKAAAGKKVTSTATKKAAPTKTTKKAAAAAPKKAKKKKAAAPTRRRKVLTDAQKQRAVIKKLREVALKEPVSRSKLAAIHVYIADKIKETEHGGKGSLAKTATAFKDLSPAEREKYNHLAVERNEARQAQYQAWVKSHTPDEIRLANNARNTLKRKLANTYKGAIAHTRLIVDDRHVKRPLSPFTFFFAERHASPDFAGISTPESSRLIAAEWKELSAGEKQRFEDQAAADRQRFDRESAALAKA